MSDRPRSRSKVMTTHQATSREPSGLSVSRRPEVQTTTRATWAEDTQRARRFNTNRRGAPAVQSPTSFPRAHMESRRARNTSRRKKVVLNGDQKVERNRQPEWCMTTASRPTIAVLLPWNKNTESTTRQSAIAIRTH